MLHGFLRDEICEFFLQNKQDTACLLAKVKAPHNNRREGVSLITWYHKQRTMRQNEKYAVAKLKFSRNVKAQRCVIYPGTFHAPQLAIQLDQSHRLQRDRLV